VLYRPFIIKDMAWKMRAIYVEKYGMPALVGKYPGGKATEEQKAAFLEAITAYQNDTGIMIPQDLALDALEISMQGNTIFAETIKDLNDAITVAVLLGFLQMGEGKNTGALRAGEVHERSEQIFISYLAEDVAEVFNEQIIQPLVVWNFGPQIAAPYLAIRQEKTKDVAMEIDVLSKAQQIGLVIAEEEAYEKLGLRRPEEGERTLEPRALPGAGPNFFPLDGSTAGVPPAESRQDAGGTNDAQKKTFPPVKIPPAA
jgi:phage gp29-like protein